MGLCQRAYRFSIVVVVGLMTLVARPHTLLFAHAGIAIGIDRTKHAV